MDELDHMAIHEIQISPEDLKAHPDYISAEIDYHLQPPIPQLKPGSNALVICKKPNGRLRTCLDPTDLNKVIKREQHPVPTVDDITPILCGSTLFSKPDAKQGY